MDIEASVRQYIEDNPLAWDDDRENPRLVAARSVPLGPRQPWRVCETRDPGAWDQGVCKHASAVA